MLTLTENASTAVRDLTTRAGLPDSGGLRIAESQQQLGSFELALVPEAVPGDDVIDSDGATVFVSPETSTALADLTLDADPSATGAPGFTLAPQD
ncbi:adhesin [Cellulomonas sp. IC4_254]|uniref:adhesin n=1 Tax=Cellulomonas sp. IC4_254 TaxID=2714040 RepID=UPI00142469F1|nr:adhesin [Cellulomonas sp. IC4_254]